MSQKALMSTLFVAKGSAADLHSKRNTKISADSRADFRSGGKIGCFVVLTAFRSCRAGVSSKAALRVGCLTAKLLR